MNIDVQFCMNVLFQALSLHFRYEDILGTFEVANRRV